ncbi:MAG: hypothetical protein AB7T49_13400 [Oligoflexales bacterium]
MNKQRILGFILTLAFSTPALSDETTDTKETETLSDMMQLDKDSKSGGFMAPVASYGRLGGKSVSFLGGRMAWIYNRKFLFGAGGYSANANLSSPVQSGPGTMDFSYGGLLVGYIHNTEALVHPVFLVQAGWGDLAVERNDDTKLKDEMTVIEPEALVEVNLFDNCRLGLGASYRIASGVDRNILPKSQIEGLSGTLAVNFGRF